MSNPDRLVQTLPEGHGGVPELATHGHHSLIRQPGRRPLEQVNDGFVPPLASQGLDQDADKPLYHSENNRSFISRPFPGNFKET